MAQKKKSKSTATNPAPAAQLTPTPAVDLSHITPDLRPLAKPIAELTSDPRNARLHGEKNLKSVVDSLRRFGQQKPIVVDADGVVQAGNGTLAAAKELGWTHIAISRTHLRGAEARAFAIADNRTAELAEWDVPELLAQLDELEDAGITMGDLAFDDADLTALQKLVDGEDEEGTKARRDKGTKKGDVANGGGAGFKIVITCQSEAQQRELLEEMDARGLGVRSLSQ